MADAKSKDKATATPDEGTPSESGETSSMDQLVEEWVLTISLTTRR